jgi:hypothetical protein
VLDPDMPSSNAVLIDDVTAKGKLQKAAVKRNKIVAMANFPMASQSRSHELNLQS